MIPVRLTAEPDGRVCMESPYNFDFIQQFKVAIPWDGRTWEADRKRWLVSLLYEDVLLNFLQSQGCQVQDRRPQPPTPVAPPAPPAPVPEMPRPLREAFDALDLQYHAPLCAAEAVFRAYSKYHHPDKGGDPERFHRINNAIKVIRAALDSDDAPEDDIPF